MITRKVSASISGDILTINISAKQGYILAKDQETEFKYQLPTIEKCEVDTDDGDNNGGVKEPSDKLPTTGSDVIVKAVVSLIIAGLAIIVYIILKKKRVE